MKIKDFELYDKDGWLNVPAIDKLPTWLNVIIGPRQVGKTYGTLKLMIESGRRFAYWRRSEDELDFISANPDVNPFRAFRDIGQKVDIVKYGKHDYRIGHSEYDPDTKKTHLTDEIGAAAALLTVAKLRGFDGSAYTDIVFDEFIPERIVVQRKAEGDACVNGYITYSGNRELEGKPPLKLWLLANANSIKSPVLNAWDLLPYVERLMRSGKEWLVSDSGIFLAMPKSERKITERKTTKALGHLAKAAGNTYQMAAENKFSYDDLTQIRPQSVKGMEPFMQIAGMYLYFHTGSIYVCKTPHNRRPIFTDSQSDKNKLFDDHKELIILYARGLVYFDAASTLMQFRDYFGYK